MTAPNPTPADLRQMATNLLMEGQTSRAEVLQNAADELQDAKGLLDVALGYLRDLIHEPNSYTARNDAREWLEVLDE